MFKAAHTQALPGVRSWERRLANAVTFKTVGGRRYCHDPERPYKSPNTSIQGSSADQSKEVMLAVQPEAVALGGSLCSMAHDESARVPVATRRSCANMPDGSNPPDSGARDVLVPMRGEGYVRQRWQE
jgi:hypothetical protein